MSGVEFSINGKMCQVPATEIEESLSDFIRKRAFLTGTKVMCREGGCGACIVTAKILHPVTNKYETFSVNSCLVSVYSCHRWEITTIEGIGSRHEGYHEVQKTLAQYNGSQCGYCSPGFVMNMYSLLKKNGGKGLTMKEIENSFDSNICRCTGFRPISDAFKSFAKDADPNLYPPIKDIEDLPQLCQKTKAICIKTCEDILNDDFCMLDAEVPVQLTNSFATSRWFKVYTIKDIFSVFDQHGTDSYRLVAGNTAQGVYNFYERVKDIPKIMIDIRSVAELRKYSYDANLVLGANMTLNETINVLLYFSKKNVDFSYATEMSRFLKRVANISVRNIGTLAGNLMIKHTDNRFPSDVFLVLETVGATLTIVQRNNKILNVTMTDFLQLDMTGNIIHSINLPPITNCCFKVYKVTKRAQSDYGIVNAGFLCQMSSRKEIALVNIVYGGINRSFTRAQSTEKFLLGKNLSKEITLTQAIQCLNNEIFPDDVEVEPTADYRKKLAVGLFYKFAILISAPEAVNPRIKSGGTELERALSSGKQEYTTNKDIWPMNQPMKKKEALEQCSGEAMYINDIDPIPDELFAAFVLSTEYTGVIDKIDGKDALSMDGVVALFTHEDIPGTNSFTPLFPGLYIEGEEILSSGVVKYHGQPVAVIVATSEALANEAAFKVKVTYKPTKKNRLYLKVKDVLDDPDAKGRILNVSSYDAKSKGNNVQKVIKGTFDCSGQYHFTMETQVCVCVPTEDGLDLFSSGQWLDWTQKAISGALKIPHNKININVRRLGGGFGSKISRSIQIAAACALAAYKLNKPVRLIMSMETNMAAVGKRPPCYAEYEVGVDNNGVINYLNNTFYDDLGCSLNENDIALLAIESFNNVYDLTTWTVSANVVATDTPSNTYYRGPGTVEGVSMIEHIMEHIATEVNKDPLDVRRVNVPEEHKHINEIIDELKTSSDYLKRKSDVEKFNNENRWKKRGLSLMPMRFNIIFYGILPSFVSVYHGDGTVSISCGGVEVGQGIYTKVAQVAAHTLGIPVEDVTVKPYSNLISANAIFTGGSVTSDQCCFATIQACKIILERLQPIRTPDMDWKNLVEQAFTSQISLTAQYMSKTTEFEAYNVYGAIVTEVEVDMLTGRHQVRRVDILEDSGLAVNPQLDVGQVEGAFVQGLGYWTSEEIKYSKKTGELLTNRTWTYKPPLMTDIPIDFRLKLLGNIPAITRAKTACEPPLVLAYSVVPAMRQAIASARKDGGLPTNWFSIGITHLESMEFNGRAPASYARGDLPLTPEHVLQATAVQIDQFKFL